MSSIETQILWTLAAILVAVASAAGLLGFAVLFVRSVFLRAESTSDPWRFNQRLKRRWAKPVSGCMPRIVRDQRELVLDLRANTSTAAGLCAWGFGTLAIFVPAFTLSWKFEPFRSWTGFLACVGLAVGFGTFFALVAFLGPQRFIPKRRLLQAGLRLAGQARTFGPNATAQDKRSISSSGRAFLDSAQQLGIPGDDRTVRRISAQLSGKRRRNHRKINEQVVEGVQKLVQQVYEGEFDHMSSPKAVTLLSTKSRRRMAAMSSLPVVVVIVGAIVGWILDNLRWHP